MTLGNHLDNDIVIAGEDVNDFHLRFELTDRGPVLIPLSNATANVNGHEIDRPLRLIIGDVLSVGQDTMQVGVEVESMDAPDRWLLAAEDGSSVEISGEVSIGRSEKADLSLAESHVSRFHARMIAREGCVWLQDLRSANGTRVNGERVEGGVRLFHGDRINFDRISYQLVGRGGDLTPVANLNEPMQRIDVPIPGRTEPRPQTKPSSQAGPHLEILYASGEQALFPLKVGLTEIGASGACDVVIDGPGIAERHAQIEFNADGVFLTEINAQPGSTGATQKLHPDAAYPVGEARLIFRHPAILAEDSSASWTDQLQQQLRGGLAGVDRRLFAIPVVVSVLLIWLLL